MGRYQKVDEPFMHYSTVMITLMRQAGGFSRAEQLEILYDNMYPEYKTYVRVDDVRDLAELQSRAREFEDIEGEKRDARKREKVAVAPTVAAVYNKTECCWRCK